jgi:hypothetical protein
VTTDNNIKCIRGVMVSTLASNTVDRGFEPWLGQTKDYKIGICCFSAKHAALRRKSKDWLNRNQDNVSEWGDMFQWASTIKIQLSMLVVIISIKINLFSPWYSWKIAELALNNNHSLTPNVCLCLNTHHKCWGWHTYSKKGPLLVNLLRLSSSK